ncbi:uncharacterized protein [Elaeis guineensis]|uniref:uncharacterized protein isoform X3 n=1 Tax=Elaeis guineensis var. tenera TaxID=51953 RepID=UPI003C6D5DAE
MEEDAAAKLRSDFLQVLRSRRRNPDVPLSVELGKPVTNPMYQGNTILGSRDVMESCPKENIEDFKDRLIEENLYLITEESEQGRLPVLILSIKQSTLQRRPAIVILHSSYKCKEWLRPLLEAYASRGYITVSIDSRYHGERASSTTTYQDVWDLIKLGDYLMQREDIDASKIGITGESLGGMHAWFAAAADTRYSVVAPIIGVQGFQWAIENDQWQARVDSIKSVFEGWFISVGFNLIFHILFKREARIDLGKSTLDKEVVKKVWDRIAPGLASQFDSPYTIPIIAPRPQLILNGAEDPRCPLAGIEIPCSTAVEAYKRANCPEKFKLIAEPGIGHKMTASMVKEASDWFDKFLK